MASSLLFQKLAKIIGEMSRVPKRGRNEFHKYDYVTEADLLDAVRAKLSEAGVAYFFSVDSVTTRSTDAKGGPITEVVVTVTFADGQTGETYSVHGAGAGQDAGDKGVYKAITGAQKYVLMKTFMVPTGDDPELEDAPAVKKPASGGKGKPATAMTPSPEVAAQLVAIATQGGDAVIPSGKFKDRTVDSLTLPEAEDLLPKLPAGNKWHNLVALHIKALKAGAADPALGAAAEAFGAVAVK